MGPTSRLDRRRVRFGVFELDTSAGELRKHGVSVRLQDQPLKLLLCLLETAGEVCTREVLISKIWPDGTFVDYDRGLNSAATRLRQVLGDSADSPRYIETVGRKGYRFIAPVEDVSYAGGGAQTTEKADEQPQPAPPEPATEWQARDEPYTGWRVWAYAAVLAAGVAAGMVIDSWRMVEAGAKPLARLSVDLESR